MVPYFQFIADLSAESTEIARMAWQMLTVFFSLKKLVDACDFILFIYFERNSREDPYFFFCFLY